MKKVDIVYSSDSSVASVIINDGKGNVIDHIVMEELQEALDEFKRLQGLKLITFEGAGKHFSFGASVEEHKKDLAATMLQNFHRLFYTLKDLSIPTAAIISGNCLGGGLELALMCNFMFADKTARLGQPEISLGVFPPPASILLPEKIGLARAEDMLITGKIVNAEAALSMGLVNELFDTRVLMDEGVKDWVNTHILPKSASSLRFGVKAARIKFNHIMSNFLPQLESLYVGQLMQTHDANEGINSFLEKRKPQWNNN